MGGRGKTHARELCESKPEYPVKCEGGEQIKNPQIKRPYFLRLQENNVRGINRVRKLKKLLLLIHSS